MRRLASTCVRNSISARSFWTLPDAFLPGRVFAPLVESCDDEMIFAHSVEIKESTGPESLAFSGEFVPYWVGIQMRRTQSSTSS